MKHTNDYRIEVTIRNGDFGKVDSATFSGRGAIVDAIYYLDTKYNPSAYALLKKFGIIDAANPFATIIKKLE